MVKAFDPVISLAWITIMLLVGVALVQCAPVVADMELQQSVASREEGTKMRENEKSSEDFMLTISVKETSLAQGENFKVNVKLKNNSGEGKEIAYSVLFWPSIPNWNIFGDIAIDPPEFRTRFLEADSVLQNIGFWGNEDEKWLIGSDLEPGTHELRFRATFYLNWLQNNQQQMEVWSNTILLTVQ